MVNLSIGIMKIDMVTAGATVAQGTNVVQNRNQTKQNFANYAVGDGWTLQSIRSMANIDSDFVDNVSQDGANFAVGPIV